MSNRKLDKLALAFQKWSASGRAKKAPLMERLATLDDIMKRNDLSGTEKGICWYLLYNRTNNETSFAAATDQNLADALGVTLRAIKKCKQSLKAKNILGWDTERLNGQNTITSYWFNYRVCSAKNSPSNGTEIHHSTRRMVPDRAPQHGTEIHHSTTGENAGTYYAKFGSAELDAWDRWSRIHRGKAYPRDRAGGWTFPSQWPPRTQIDLEDLLAT